MRVKSFEMPPTATRIYPDYVPRIMVLFFVSCKSLWGDLDMSDHVYKHIEITGTSSVSMQNAVENAIARASQTVQHMRWFVVTESRGTIEQGSVAHWQVTIKIGFTLNE
jgi:flavin-binding protein dodecin